MRPTLALAALALALAACTEQAEEAAGPEIAETPNSIEPSTAASDQTGMPEGGVPQEAQGRWGLTAADCTSTRGDAKGLLTVSADTLTFYESVGTVAKIKARTEGGIRADFAFTGEGMTWTSDVALTVQDDGRTLVRREYGAEASPGAFKYTRCS